MKVLIGTNNKGKVEGAKQAFEKFYENVWFNKRSIYNGNNWIYKWRNLERLEILYSACPRLLLNSVQSSTIRGWRKKCYIKWNYKKIHLKE